MLCPALGDFGVRSWLLLPPLFLCAATGLAAGASSALGEAGWAAVSAPLLFGCAAALALLTRFHARWRRVVRFGYPVLLLGCALAFDQVRFPVVPAFALGAVALALLGVLLARTARRPAHCGQR